MTRLDPRARLQLLIALAGDCTAELRAQHEQLARAAGLSGAEIDAARARRSFDARVHAAIALACAVRQGADLAEAERACAAAGFDADSRALIIRLGRLAPAEAQALLATIRADAA